MDGDEERPEQQQQPPPDPGVEGPEGQLLPADEDQVMGKECLIKSVLC